MKKTLTTSDIISQKLDHIKYFQDEGLHDALFVGMARDACYTANNSIEFKKKQLADTLADYDRHMKKGDENAADRSEAFAGRIYAELDVLKERLEIEKAVYFTITGGEEWTPYKKRPVARKKIPLDQMRKEIA